MLQCNKAEHNTIQYNTTAHNSTQHNTSAHNTAQPDTIHMETSAKTAANVGALFIAIGKSESWF